MLERSRRTRGIVWQSIDCVGVFSGEDALDPDSAPEITDLTLRDPIEPCGGVAAIECVESAASDEEYLLRDVVPVCLGPAKCANPPEDALTPDVIEG
jgi:rRNA maturation protein Nop10